MLQSRAHLNFKLNLIEFRALRIFEQRFRDSAYKMQRVIAKAIEFVHFALVNAIFPVNFKQALDKCCNFINIVIIERNYAGTQNIGQIRQRLVLAIFTFKLFGKACLGLDSRFNGSHINVILCHFFLEQIANVISQPFIDRHLFAIILKDHRFSRIQPIFFNRVFAHYFLPPNIFSIKSVNSA